MVVSESNQTLERKSKLIKPNALCTNSMRKEYSVKEAYNPTDESCTGKEQCPPEKIFFST